MRNGDSGAGRLLFGQGDGQTFVWSLGPELTAYASRWSVNARWTADVEAHMDPFIEVIGQGTLTEKVVEYRADLSVTVRAAQGDAALKEAIELRNCCVRTLKESGIKGSELTEGGGQVWRPWFWKKKPGQEVSHKILIACPDRDRLFKALGALEPLFDNQRSSLLVSMRQPKFEAISGERSTAMSSAIANAKSSAEIIAHEAGLRVTGVTQVEELDQRKERSGAYGDEDWRGAYAIAGAELSEEAPEPIDAAVRQVVVRYRVRFSVEKKTV